MPPSPCFSQYFRSLSSYLASLYDPSELSITGVEDAGVTGNFEVFEEGTGEVIHSKRGGGGKAESDEERRKIIEGIERIRERG